MSPQEKILLYYLSVHTDVEGEYVVGRHDIATLLDVSVVTAKKRMSGLVEKGFVDERKKNLARGLGYKWIYNIAKKGVLVLDLHVDIAIELYHAHNADKLLAVIKKASKISKPRGEAIKRHEKQLVLL